MCILLSSPYACNHVALNHILFCPAGITVSNICDDYSHFHNPPMPRSKWLCIECAPVKYFQGIADEEHFLHGVGNNGEVMKALNRKDGEKLNELGSECPGKGKGEEGRGSWRDMFLGKPQQRMNSGSPTRALLPVSPPRVMKYTQDGYLVFDLFQEIRNEERREEKRRERDVKLKWHAKQGKGIAGDRTKADSTMTYFPSERDTRSSFAVKRSAHSTIRRIRGPGF
jgi:hypothetical protein